MGKKSSLISIEIWIGLGLILLGLAALGMGRHDLISQALTPFGIGLILSDLLARFGKAARERVKVLIRRDGD
jgi:hypothetical protein